MLDEVAAEGDAERWVKRALDSGERLMGFGHRVYRAEDPRARVLRRTAREIGAPRLEVAEQLEQAALAELQARKPDRVLATNVEFWSAVVLDYAERAARAVHADVLVRARRRLGRAHPRAEARGPADPADGPVRRAGPALGGLGQRRRAELMEAAARGGERRFGATKRLVLVAAILGTTVVTVDSTVVNVALPAIADDLGGGLAGQQWTANAYLVTLCSLLLIGGSLGDIFGERRVFALGVPAFGVTSLLCALAPTIEVLVAARALQGVAGALLTPAALAVIVATFPPDERGKAVGAWTAWGGIGTVLGPVVGGQLVDTASWRWIFAINVPIVLVTLVLILRVVPAGRERDPDARVDVVGALLCALGLAGITFGLIEQPLRGWGDPAVALPLALGALLFAALHRSGRRAGEPPDAAARRCSAGATSRSGNIETFPMYGGLGLHVLLPRAVPAAGGGLQRARGGQLEHPGDARDVRALDPLRHARRPPRAALLHGRGAARGGGRASRC